MKPPFLSAKQKLLVAAVSLSPVKPFHQDDLVKAAWELFPEEFSLERHALPDSRNILSYVHGHRGLYRTGFVSKPAKKTYQLTDSGRQAVEEARKYGWKPLRTTARPATHWRAPLARMAASEAFRKWLSGNREFTQERHARAFWGVPPDQGPARVRRQVGITDRVLAAAVAVVGLRGEVLLEGGRVVRPADLNRLAACHRWLVRQFGPGEAAPVRGASA